MVPGMKTGRRKKTATDPIALPSGTFSPVVVTPQTLSDETQSPDDTQTCVEETRAHGVGKRTSNRVRSPTVGKGVQKRLTRKKREKLHVYVNRMLNALTGGNATPATNELGLQIRRLCPLKGVKSWKKIDQSIKDAVVQAVLADENGELDFSEFYSKSHKSKKTNEWIDPKCGELHDAMVNLQVTATDAGIPLTHEELSRQVLGQRKNYLCGFGIGPRPYSPSDSVARSRDKQMEAMRSEIDVLQENLIKEKEKRQRDREEMTREREELMKEVEEGKKAREAQQEQLNHLNSVIFVLFGTALSPKYL
ncbi:hypothetical protein ACSBR2_033645 [Camellia fascicularis]